MNVSSTLADVNSAVSRAKAFMESRRRVALAADGQFVPVTAVADTTLTQPPPPPPPQQPQPQPEPHGQRQQAQEHRGFHSLPPDDHGGSSDYAARIMGRRPRVSGVEPQGSASESYAARAASPGSLASRSRELISRRRQFGSSTQGSTGSSSRALSPQRGPSGVPVPTGLVVPVRSSSPTGELRHRAQQLRSSKSSASEQRFLGVGASAPPRPTPTVRTASNVQAPLHPPPTPH
jgi:hypothetical protein